LQLSASWLDATDECPPSLLANNAIDPQVLFSLKGADSGFGFPAKVAIKLKGKSMRCQQFLSLKNAIAPIPGANREKFGSIL
jgi:hypothetical protein